jgi:prepilin-type N-terminal cleavage/methylation domain-containing protein
MKNLPGAKQAWSKYRKLSTENAYAFSAFTLSELLIALTVGGIILAAAGTSIIGQIQTTGTAASIEKLRASWAQATKFMETEINLSERIYTDLSSISLPPQCDPQGFQFKLALDLGRNLPLAIYGISSSPSTLASDNTLWRCGPAISPTGAYLTQYSVGILTDGLASDPTSGFSATKLNPNDLKSVNISLAFKADKGNNFNLGSISTSRINPLFIIPRDVSSCSLSLAANIATFGTNITLPSPGIACGTGTGSNSITGSNGDDILEASEIATSATISGVGGNNYMRGSNSANNIINGGAGNDILIGRSRDDTLNGTGGNNQYLPGGGSNVINGSVSGSDVVYLTGNLASYTISNSCTKSSCTITRNGEAHTMTNVDTVIFNDSRRDLQ